MDVRVEVRACASVCGQNCRLVEQAWQNARATSSIYLRAFLLFFAQPGCGRRADAIIHPGAAAAAATLSKYLDRVISRNRMGHCCAVHAGTDGGTRNINKYKIRRDHDITVVATAPANVRPFFSIFFIGHRHARAPRIIIIIYV